MGRIDPCPCGSGRKYKKCHLPLVASEREAKCETERLYAFDGRMMDILSEYAAERFGAAWRRFENDFEQVVDPLQFAIPWSLYGFRVRGRTVAETYLVERAEDCSLAERAWLVAQAAAWLSVWEVAKIEPTGAVTFRDLLSGEVRVARDPTESRTLLIHDALLGRIVDHEGRSIVCGMHPYSLPPLEAADVLRKARCKLRVKGNVPVGRLRDGRFGRFLINIWEKAVGSLEQGEVVPPRLCNTDGDPVLLTIDHFDLESGACAEVAARLARMEGVEPRDPEAGRDDDVFAKPGNPMHPNLEKSVVGQAWLSDDVLHIEANSLARADALRARIEKACGSPPAPFGRRS